MNRKASMVFLSGALALTILSVCASAFAEEHVTPAGQSISETQGGDAMSLGSLKERLRGTKAISLTGKLGLKMEIDSLVGKFRVAHDSGSEVRSLRQPYDSLLARIKSLLVRDPQLVTDIALSREAIWDVLTDRTKFAGLG